MALQYDYVHRIAKPLSILMSTQTEDPNYVFAGQFDPSLFEETKVDELPDGWYQDTYYDSVSNINSFIYTASANQAELYTLLPGVQAAISNGDYTIAQQIVEDSTLPEGVKTDLVNLIVAPY